MTLTRKGWARIYVEKHSDIPPVKDIIREMSEFEFDYLPPDLIAPFPNILRWCIRISSMGWI